MHPVLILNIAVSFALAYFGVVHVSTGKAVGDLLLACIVVHWTLYAKRKGPG